MDLKHPEAIELVKKMVKHCDVLVENFRGGVMDKLGLSYDVLKDINPGLIYASINGYGSTGPWKNRRAYATVVNAETGMTGLQARARGGVATNDPHSHADVYTGMEAAAGILAALFQRTSTGAGQHIDISMAQTMLYVNEHVHNELFEEEVSANVIRSFQPGDYPILQTGDGTYVVVSGHPAEKGTFDLFVKAMNRPELLQDPRFVDVESRLQHLDEVVSEIRQWARSVHTAQEIEDVMAQSGLAMGVMRTMKEIASTEWAKERNVLTEVDDRSGATFRVPNSPWVFSTSDTSTQGMAKFRGEDNEIVLSELAGLTHDEVVKLTEAGVLSQRVPRTES
jgi:crotonobetainyl-CoA:carnitine CoA-transferase CaiB-like acyl-CoA transferase